VPTPAQTYYAACVGHWRAPIHLTITDPAALARSGMGWLDRVGLRLLARWPAWLGRVHLDTQVVVVSDDVVHHHTVIRWLGLPLRRSLEVYTLHPDGHGLTITGDMAGDGTVDATATRARYTLRWLGVTVRQHTVRDGDRVTVVQEGPGFGGTQVLVRQSP
jgi:hypothetical protein